MRKLLNISLFLLVFVLLSSSGCRSLRSSRTVGPAAPELAEKYVASRSRAPIIAAPVTATPARAKLTVKPERAATSECGPYIVSRAYPCAEYGLVQLDKTMPKEVELNMPFDYSIKVTNLTDMTLADVVITERLSDNFKFTGADPIPKEDANNLVWTIKSLGPEDIKQITVSGIATDIGCLKHYTTATTQVIPACVSIKVVHSKLKLTRISPAGALLCDAIPVKFVVTNSGTGSAENVKITETLPPGLLTADGESEVVFNAGTLAAGQTREFLTKLRAAKTGKYVSKAAATSASGQKVETEPTTMVVGQPVLAISKTGPERHYLGRPVVYEITVTNNGDAPAKRTVLEDTIPAGVTSIRATTGAKISGAKLVWQLGTIAPNASKEVRVSYMLTQAGTVTNSANATAYCAEAVAASARTSAVSIPAVLMEVIDVEDPVQTGNNTTYVIRVTNQGSATDTNIRIACTLEDNVQYVSSSGATTGLIEGNMLKFAPLSSLARKTKATWRVVVRAVEPGDTRFKVTMNSDQLTRPVEETEATRIYK